MLGYRKEKKRRKKDTTNISFKFDQNIIITESTFFNQKSYEFGKTRAANYVKGLEKALLDVSNSIEVRHDL